MRVLVTGAAGFLGSHLTDQLIADGHEVIGVDNLFTGSKGNIRELMAHPNFDFIRHDVTFPLYLEVDAIYNLASPASPINYQRDPVQTMKTNVVGAINVLGLAKRLDVPIFQASTSEIYGDPEIHPQTEDYWGRVNTIGPRACYDEGKRAAETLFFDYHRQHKVRIRVARIFNTYGPRMALDDGRVISNFVIQSLRGKDLTIYGDGSQTRSFCYVDDMVSGFTRMMDSAEDSLGPVNLGNDFEVTILELAQKVLELTGSASKISFLPLPEDDPKQRQPDISLAKSMLKWEPTVSLSEGLQRTIAHFERTLNQRSGS